MSDRFSNDKARDSLAFDPLPVSPYIMVTESHIEIKTLYSEKLSQLIKSLPGANWTPSKRCWHLPFSAIEKLRSNLPEILELADKATISADEETRKRERQFEEATRRWAAEKTKSHNYRSLLRREFLTVDEFSPRFVLTLEAIGDDTATNLRAFGFKPRNWVAQIYGTNDRGGWVRDFLKGAKEYSKANSKGSRGVMVTYLLQQGPIYQIASPVTWRQTDKYFARVINSELKKITEDEVRECLEK